MIKKILSLALLILLFANYAKADCHPEQAVIVSSGIDVCNPEDPTIYCISFWFEDIGGDGNLACWEYAEVDYPHENVSGWKVDRNTGRVDISVKAGFYGPISFKVRGYRNFLMFWDYGSWSNTVTFNVRNDNEQITKIVEGPNLVLMGNSYTYSIENEFDHSYTIKVTKDQLMMGTEYLSQYNTDVDRYSGVINFSQGKYSGDLTFRAHGNFACGLTNNYTTKDVHVVPIPVKPVHNSGKTSFLCGESATFKINNYDPNASYDWMIEPSSVGTLTENSNGTCSITFSNASATYFTIKTRAQAGGQSGPWSETLRCWVAPPPEQPVIEGPTTVCYSPNKNQIQYNAQSIYNVNWSISGTGATISASGKTAVVTIGSNTTQFQVKVKSTNGIIESPMAIHTVNVTSGQVDIDFGDVNPCSGQGLIELTEIEPAGGIYWVHGREVTTTVYASDYLSQTGSKNVESEIGTTALFGQYLDGWHENILKFNLGPVPSNATIISAKLIMEYSPLITPRNIQGRFGKLQKAVTSGTTNSYYESVKGTKCDLDLYEMTSDPGKYQLDMTGIVTDWVESGQNYGIFLDPEPYEFQSLYFNTQRYSTVGQRPRIEITYTVDNTINTNAPGTSYQISYKFNQGACYSLESTTVTVLQKPTVNFTAPDFCQDEIPASITGGSANLPGSGYFSGSGVTGNKFYNDAPGSYPVEYHYTANNGCSAVASDEIIINPLPNLSINSVDAICAGNQVTASIPSGSFPTISWNVDGQTISSQTSINFTPAATFKGIKHITVDVTDFNGCSNTIEKDIQVYEKPVLSLNDRTECKNNFIQYYPDNVSISQGNLQYSWSNGANTDHISIYVQSSQTYSLTVTSDDGCTATDAMNILALDLPNVSIQGDEICWGESVQIEALPYMATWQYSWSNGAFGNITNHTPEGIGENSITVWVEDGNGCMNSATAQIYVNELPEFDLPDDETCLGVPKIISAPTGYRSYHWNTGVMGSSSITVNPPATQVYSCEVEDFNGCSNSESMTMTVNNPATLTMPDIDACQGDQVTLYGPSGFSQYNWNTGSQSQNINVMADQTRNYTLNVVDMNGCQNSETFTVYSNPYPSFSMPDIGITQGSSKIVSAPSGYAQYLWSTGHTTESIEVSPKESTRYWTRISTLKSCSSADTFRVTVYDLPEITMPDIEACEGETVVLEGPEGYVSYLWTMGEYTWTARKSEIIAETTCIISLEVTDEFGGVGGTSFTLTVFENPVITCQDTLICVGDQVTLSTQSGYESYLWSTGDTVNYTLVSPSATQQYNLIVLSEEGCETTKLITVTVDNPFTEFTASMQHIRPGDPVQFYTNFINSDHSYTWDFGDGNEASGSDAIHYYYNEGVYDVSLTVLSENNCIAVNLKENLITVDNNPNSISEDEISSGINIYPNPVKEILWIAPYGDLVEKEFYISVTTLDGSEIYRKKIHFKDILELNVSGLKKGIYFINLRSDEFIFSEKIIKVD